jgi:hypothetical protein
MERQRFSDEDLVEREIEDDEPPSDTDLDPSRDEQHDAYHAEDDEPI